MATQSLFTETITNSTFTITGDMSLRAISLKLVSGAGTYTGSLTVGGIASGSISLSTDNPVTLSTGSTNVLTGIVIDCSGGGVIQIIGGQ